MERGRSIYKSTGMAIHLKAISQRPSRIELKCDSDETKPAYWRPITTKTKASFPLCELLSPRGFGLCPDPDPRLSARAAKRRTVAVAYLFVWFGPHKGNNAITTGDKFGTDFRNPHFMIRSVPCSPPPSCSDQLTLEIRRRTQPRQNNNNKKKKERRTSLFTTETRATRCAHESLLD
jgi:hypothetical protein